MWKDIPGYEGKYQASSDGSIRRLRKSGAKILTPYLKPNRRGSDRFYVHLSINGETKEYTVIRLICDTFLGGVPNGKIPVHINGMQTDNAACNIEFISVYEAGKRYGREARSMPVKKLDSDGNEVDVYRSARECARENHMSYQTILDRCNHKYKGAFAPDGFIYLFANDRRIKKMENSWIPTSIGAPPRNTLCYFIVRKGDKIRKCEGKCVCGDWVTTDGIKISNIYVEKWRVVDG